jgi:hypothetical protein
LRWTSRMLVADLPITLNPGCYDQSAGWSSQVARWAHNPKVEGSNPSPATNTINQLLISDQPFSSFANKPRNPKTAPYFAGAQPFTNSL